MLFHAGQVAPFKLVTLNVALSGLWDKLNMIKASINIVSIRRAFCRLEKKFFPIFGLVEVRCSIRPKFRICYLVW